MWDELWIEKEIAADVLAAAIGKAHGLSGADVVVVDGIAAEASRDAAVTVHRTRGGGQFATRIQLDGRVPADRRVFCARLASALGCKVLGDDGKVNPLTFMLYEPGNAKRVALDAAELEHQNAVITGPFDERDEDEDYRPTRPVRRVTEPTEYRATRGGQVAHIVLDYMIEGLPRPPGETWSAELTETYANLQRLLGTLAYRKASDEELQSVRAWSDALRGTFADLEKAGWFVVEVIEASDIVLTEPWDPEQPAIKR